ncbi:MAG: response regulator [Myxococcales bacterium]
MTRILLVDDNPDDVELTLRALRRSGIGCDITVARDGVEALALLHPPGGAPAPQPDLVLLDLKLPRVDGLEVLARVRTDVRTRCLPVVVLTSSLEEQDVSRAYGLGANSYIRKPVDFTAFLDTVRQLGSYWLALNVPAPQGRSP